MSEPYKPTNPEARPGMTGPANDPTIQRAGEDLRAAAREAKAAASEVASTVSSEAATAAETLKQEGRALYDTAIDRADQAARDGTRMGAEQAQGVARAIHRAADELEKDNPQLARLVHDAAGSVDGIATAFRNKSPRDMLRSVESFARQQPIAFFGVAALAGFAISRFARASAMHSSPQGYGQGYGQGYPQHNEMARGYAPPSTQPGMSQGSGMTSASTVGGMDNASGGVTSPSTMGGMDNVSSQGDAASRAPGWVEKDDGTKRPSTLASASLGGAAAYRPRGGSENG